MRPIGDFNWTGGDCHVYNNHFEQVRRVAAQPFGKPPSILDYEYDDFEILEYTSHPAIKAPVAV